MTDERNLARIAELDEVWTSVADLADGLDEAAWATPTDLPGWTAKDCLSHLVGTELMLMGEPAPDVAVDHLEHLANPFAAVIEVWVEARRPRTGAEVAAEWREVHPRRLAELRALPDEAWDAVGPSPVGDVPFRDFMEVRVFDSWMHEQDIRRAVDRPGPLTGRCAEVAVGRVRAGLGFIVGKRAAAPDGSTVVVEVTGPAGGTYAVAVDGRAREVDEVPTDPTVRLTLDVEAFCALGGGRWRGEVVRRQGRVAVAGDEALADRILAGMAITP